MHLHCTVLYCICPSFLGWRVPKVVPAIWWSRPLGSRARSLLFASPLLLFQPPGIPVASGTSSWMLPSLGSDTSVYSGFFLFYFQHRKVQLPCQLQDLTSMLGHRAQSFFFLSMCLDVSQHKSTIVLRNTNGNTVVLICATQCTAVASQSTMQTYQE